MRHDWQMMCWKGHKHTKRKKIHERIGCENILSKKKK